MGAHSNSSLGPKIGTSREYLQSAATSTSLTPDVPSLHLHFLSQQPRQRIIGSAQLLGEPAFGGLGFLFSISFITALQYFLSPAYLGRASTLRTRRRKAEI